MTIQSDRMPLPMTKIRRLDGYKIPVWLQTIQVVVDQISYLEKARSLYGDIFQAKLAGFPPFVILGHPEAVERVFLANPDCFDSAVTNKILQPFVGDRSVVIIDGFAHRQRRKLLMPPFHGERMRAYGRTICQITELVSRKWSDEKPFLMQAATNEITLRVIMRAVFGVEKNSRFQQLRELTSKTVNSFNSPLMSSILLFFKFWQRNLGFWSPWGKFRWRMEQIDEIIFGEIRQRQNQPPGEDILSLMMAARDEEGKAMTEIELRDELITLLFGGHETTASALAWAFYWIHRYPEVRERLLEELNSVDPETDPTAIAKLPYLNAVCSETLRIYPVLLFTFGRLLKVPMEIMGYYFEAGTLLQPYRLRC